MLTFAGRGGGGGPDNQPDSYFSDDVVEAILGVSEGKIKGLKDGSAQNFFLGDTPLLNASNSSNFKNFELNVFKGSSLGELIIPTLGGQTSSIAVNTSLAHNVAVVRQATQVDIDWLEIRFAINNLVHSSDDGARARSLHLQIQYKRSDELGWSPGILYADAGTTVSETEFTQTIVNRDDPESAITTARQQVVYNQVDEPVPTTEERNLGNIYGHRVWWFDTAGGTFAPRFYANGDFFSPDNLVVDTDVAGREVATFDDPNYIAIIDPDRENVERKIYFWNNGVPADSQIGDIWYDPTLDRLLWFNGTAWVSTLSPQGVYDPTAGQKVVSTDGVLRIHDKITSTAAREVRIKVPRTDVTYDVRVTKLTPDSSSLEDDRTDVTWESIQEVKAEPMRFPDLAVVQLKGRASEQFSSLPEFSGVYEGREVKVPSNYDPETRTYLGVWDGTWKIAYTDNPAYIGNDLVMNDRYGMNSTYPVTLEPFDVYEAGVWCDVDRFGDGRPQFTFNQLISEPQSARELAVYIFGIFGGRFFDDGNGYARLRIDNDTPAVHLFTKENVKEGTFRYSYTEVEGRKNDYTVSFKNPHLRYKEDRRRVYNQEMIDAYGRAPDEFIAVGCNNAEEAIYRATVKLLTDQTETETVTFETAREGLYLEPYDIILVSDDGSDDIITGRITGTNGTRTVYLRDNIYLEAGFEHELVINQENFEIATLAIDPACFGKATKVLTLTEDLPAEGVPEQAVFSIGQDAKPFRVMTIGEGKDGEESSENIVISAIEVSRTKYADAADETEVIQIGVPQFENDLSAVKNARVSPYTETRQGRAVQNLLLQWDPHPNKYVRKYTIASRFNDDPWVYHGDVRENRFDLADVLQGRYVFSIQAISLNGQKSIIAFADIDLSGEVRVVAPVANLILINETGVNGNVHLFDEVDAHLQWDRGVPNPAMASYRVSIYNNAEEHLRTELVGLPEFVYTRAQMRRDEATRQLKLVIVAIDVYGNESTPTLIYVKNPSPEAPLVSASRGFGSVEYAWQKGDLPDYAGSLVWVSEEPGIDPTSRAPDYDLTGNLVSVPVDVGQGLYARVALYDLFGREELNYSGEVYATSYMTVDIDPPVKPSGLIVTSEVKTSATGEQSVVMTAVWDANTEDDLESYDADIRLTGGNWISRLTGSNRMEWVVEANTSYDVRVLARDKTGNTSGYAVKNGVVSAKDTIPPGPVTNVGIEAGLTSIWLNWINPADKDLAFIEVFEGTDATFANATLIARVPGDSFARSGLDHEAERFYFMRARDTSDNMGPVVGPASATTSALLDPVNVELDGILFSPDAALNKVSWSAGSIVYGVKGRAITTKAISAGSVLHGGSDRYIYYREGNTTLSTTTNLVTAFNAQNHLVGVYRGGADFELAGGKTLINGANVISRTIGALQLVANQAVITGTAQIANAIITDAKILELSAAKLKADTVLSSTITVGGTQLGIIKNNAELGAQNPATRINSGTTTINPGQILISGGTTLSDWRRGGDETKIDGNELSTGTVYAEAAVFGQRGIRVEGLEFEHNKPSLNRLSWSAGTIRYIGDDGNIVNRTIPASSATWTSGTLYIYFEKGGTTLQATTSVTTAMAPDALVLSAYRGDADLVTDYGRTIVDGSGVKTGTIRALQMDIDQISAISTDVGAMTSGLLRSGDDKMRIELNNTRILIRDNT